MTKIYIGKVIDNQPEQQQTHTFLIQALDKKDAEERLDFIKGEYGYSGPSWVKEPEWVGGVAYCTISVDDHAERGGVLC